MKALLIAAGAGLAMGLLAGAALQVPQPAQAEPAFGFASAAFAEDPGVSLHSAVMGGESWEAPQPYIPIVYPAISYETDAPPLADITLADLQVETWPELHDVDGVRIAVHGAQRADLAHFSDRAHLAQVDAPPQAVQTGDAAQPMQVAAAPAALTLDTAGLHR